MTNAELPDVTSIKTEPLSPDSAHQVINDISPALLPALIPRTLHNGGGMICNNNKDGFELYDDLMECHSASELNMPANTTDMRSALKTSIMSKMKARGQTALPSNDAPKEYKLTKREIERREARKEQNRRAARRCRMKKKKIQIQASQEMEVAINHNVEMRNEVQSLRQQVKELQTIIAEHQKTDCKLLSHLSHQPVKAANKSKNRLPCSVTNSKPEHPEEISEEIMAHQTSTSWHTTSTEDHCSAESNIPPQDLKDLSFNGQTYIPNKAEILMDYLEEIPEQRVADEINNSNDQKFQNLSFVIHSPQSDNNTLNNSNVNDVLDCNISNNEDCSSNNNIPSWDSKDLNSCLLPEDESSENIEDILNTLIAMENKSPSSFVTQKLEHDSNNKDKEQCFDFRNDANYPLQYLTEEQHFFEEFGNMSQCNTYTPKPTAVRNLSKDFLQSEQMQQLTPTSKNSHYEDSHQVHVESFLNDVQSPLGIKTTCEDHVESVSKILLDQNMSSPIFGCVSPNLIQQQHTANLVQSPLPVPNDTSSSYHVRNTCIVSPMTPANQQQKNNFPYNQHQQQKQELLYSRPSSASRVTETSLTHPLPSSPSLYNFNQQHARNITQIPSLPTQNTTIILNTCSAPHSSNMTTQSYPYSPQTVARAPTNETPSIHESEQFAQSPYSYQLSPISEPTSVVSIVSSPGFMQMSPDHNGRGKSVFQY